MATGRITTSRRGDLTLEPIAQDLPTCDVERSFLDPWESHFLIKGDGFAMHLTLFADEVIADVAATSSKQASDLLKDLRDRIEVNPSPSAGLLIGTWTRAEGASGRHLNRVRWSGIEPNYPEATRNQLVRLMALDRETLGSGKVIVFHGPPGTGKTYALRALITEWNPWCRAELVIDPESAFTDSEYLVSLITHETHDGRPRLLVCEDVDGLLASSGSLERLLNLTDGVLGQGRDIMVLLTTNTNPRRLATALTRPGRCLAVTGFHPFTVEESRERLRDVGVPVRSSMTLAEIYEAEGKISQIRDPEWSLLTGAYL
jgi:hypothetical protein